MHVSHVFCSLSLGLFSFNISMQALMNSFIIWYVGIEAFDIYCDENNSSG